MRTMEYKGFKASIMRAERLIGNGTFGLPPGRPIEVFPVDVFKHPLSHWITGAGNYVVPVDSDWGLWFDWTMNDHANTAVLPTVKGMNPITGRRTNGFALERYEDKCPIHDIKFKDGQYCEKCDFKWPNQNYVAYPNTLWWDGFRTADGKVRQFFFTEDLAKSIPELVIGKEDAIPAFGFAFYRPKVSRVMAETRVRGGNFKGVILDDNVLWTDVKYAFPEAFASQIYYTNSSDGSQNFLTGGGGTKGMAGSCCSDSLEVKSYNNSLETKTSGGPICAFGESTKGSRIARFHEDISMRKSVKKRKSEVGVGAGAEINQGLEIDPLKLTDWEDKPSSIMRLYFIFVEQFNEIKEKGMKNLEGVKEGYMSGLPVG